MLNFAKFGENCPSVPPSMPMPAQKALLSVVAGPVYKFIQKIRIEFIKRTIDSCRHVKTCRREKYFQV